VILRRAATCEVRMYDLVVGLYRHPFIEETPYISRVMWMDAGETINMPPSPTPDLFVYFWWALEWRDMSGLRKDHTE